MTTFDTPLDHGPVRLRLGAAAGVVGLLAAAVRVLLSTGFDEQHPLKAILWAGRHPAGAFVVNLTELLAFSLVAFACITLTGLVRGRGKWLTQIGGWGTAITFLAVGLNAFGAFIAALGDFSDRRTAASVVSHAMHSPQLAPVLVLLVLSGVFPMLFGLGLCRSGLVGWWYAVPVVLDVVLGIVVNAEGFVALLTNVLPLAVVVGVWVKVLLDRARTVVGEAPQRPLPEQLLQTP